MTTLWQCEKEFYFFITELKMTLSFEIRETRPGIRGGSIYANHIASSIVRLRKYVTIDLNDSERF